MTQNGRKQQQTAKLIIASNLQKKEIDLYRFRQINRAKGNQAINV